ncbi:MAG: copper chaperone PCu(A)C [Dehalococcoidia bacterium]
MTITNKLWRRFALVGMLGVALLALVACSDSEEDAAEEEATETAAAEASEVAAEGGIEVTEVWARATAGNPGENTAIYAMIANNTGEDDVLTGVRVGEEIAARTEVHEMVQQGANMVMQEIEGGLAVASSETATLEPGGYHVMLMAVPNQLTVGQTFPATFIFEKAGEVEVQVEVREASATGSSMNH